jgi:hypothetical protein
MQPVGTGDFPGFDLIGLAFTTIGHENLILSIIILVISIFSVLLFFSILQDIKKRNIRAGIVSILLICVIFYNLFYLFNIGHLQEILYLAPLVVLWLIINNFFLWIGSIILPTCFLFPEVREQNLWKVVALCFFLTGIFRYGCEYLLSFTPASALSYVSLEAGRIYAGYNLIMIPVTVGFAFVSYWLIHEIMQRVPFVRRILGAE